MIGSSVKTRCLVLRQTPFQESSVIVSSLTANGRFDFLIRGARSQGKKKFIVNGLFRELSIEYKVTEKQTLPTLRNMELYENFDAVANHTSSYLAACEFSSFLLKNAKPQLSAEETYIAFRQMLGIFCHSNEPEPRLTFAYLTYLNENGILPEPEDEQRRLLLEEILLAAKGEKEIPSLPHEYWDKLAAWTRKLILRLT